MKTHSLLLIMVCLLVIAGCAPAPATPSVGDIQTAIAQTLTAQPTSTYTSAPPLATDMPPPTVTPFATTTPTPSGPITGQVSVAFLNLRSGPSTFFNVIEAYEEGMQVSARARVEDSDWVEVEIQGEEDDEAQIGWMSVFFLELDGDVNVLPVVHFPESLTVRGKVTDTEDIPISGVDVAVIFYSVDGDLRADAITDENGEFLIYMPEDLLGLLDIQIVGITCESPVMDENCQLSEYYELEGRTWINIPQEEPVNFLYEKATTSLTGTVSDRFGRPVADILVVAVRDDNAETVGQTNVSGEFSIPIGEGIWEVYTVIFNPREESEHLTIEVTDEAPEPVELPIP
jgi:hypothetical protein